MTGFMVTLASLHPSYNNMNEYLKNNHAKTVFGESSLLKPLIRTKTKQAK